MIVNNSYVLELINITKDFPGVKALDKVNLKLKQGEVLAVVGENGAGKSTLINCITGVFMPSEGEIRVDGEVVEMSSPLISIEKGISVVHQERNIFSTFDVAENIFIERVSGKSLSIVDKKKMHEDAKALLERVNLDLDPENEIDSLSAAQQQLIEIARALSNDSHILLLDEPTAYISMKETEMLLEIIDGLRKEGVAIVFVSHKLEEIFKIADRVQVIRDGKNIGDAVSIEDLDRDKLIEMMVGSRIMKEAFKNRDLSGVPKVLEAEKIISKGNSNSASFYLKKGEILGWYGLVGAGRTELAREVIGIDPVCKGTLKVNGRKAHIRSYKEAFKKHQIYYLSENRKEEGLFLMYPIATNITMVSLEMIKNKIGLNSLKKEQEAALEYARKIQIKMSSLNDLVFSLSGGNQQKVCVAKCLITKPEIIIIDEPTVGIDIKTQMEIHKLIYKLAKEGKSIILISSDLTELIRISDRIQIFCEGRIVGDLENDKDYNSTSTKVMNYII